MKHFSERRFRRYFKNLLIGVTAPTLCTLICWPLRDIIGHASILMTYLLGVFLVASRYGKGASISASFLSAPAFAYFFARPYFSIAIYDVENAIGLMVMMVVSYITGDLLEKVQFQAKLAEHRVTWTDFLYQLSRDLTNAKVPTDVAAITTKSIDEYFKTHSALFLSGSDNNLDCHLLKQYPEQSDDPPHLKDAQNTLMTGVVTKQSNNIYYPLTYSQGGYGVLVVPATASLLVAFAEIATFTDSLSHLIAQTLDRLELEAQAREAALQADCEMLRNSLLSSISHDLRTPLTRIIGAASTLLEKKPKLLPSDCQELKLVVEEAEHMSELTEKLLNMAKLASGQIVLHRDWNAIEEIVGSVLNRLDKNLSGRPVRTHLPDLPLIWVDAVLLEQVLLNLIENAIKYTPPGSPIDIEASSFSDRLHLAVIDYGSGLSKDKLTRLFEKFYRGNPESDQSGVGLGLTLCKAIIEAHGGHIQAGNREGKGAEFIIDLPLVSEPTTAK